ncbi:hypothetical protein [Haloarcula sp. CBA1127]|uniref:hypothetical protein n=1 Tax=Haloarcula sp. CBA1127 TaxID=1765055 RepID=UPI0012AB5962|nr:hypothetical protein [Haloarcula sp. CBA1127]
MTKCTTDPVLTADPDKIKYTSYEVVAQNDDLSGDEVTVGPNPATNPLNQASRSDPR